MRKQLIIVGIIILLIVVGLSGCNEQSSKSTISDMYRHSNTYINQNVTIIGNSSLYSSDNYWITDSTGASIIATNSNNVIKPTPLVTGSQYKFTGIVRYGQPPGCDMANTVYLVVTKIEAV